MIFASNVQRSRRRRRKVILVESFTEAQFSNFFFFSFFLSLRSQTSQNIFLIWPQENDKKWKSSLVSFLIVFNFFSSSELMVPSD